MYCIRISHRRMYRWGWKLYASKCLQLFPNHNTGNRNARNVKLPVSIGRRTLRRARISTGRIKTQSIQRTTSQTDPDCGSINHGKKSGLGYHVETTVECGHGIITGIDTYPANQKESSICLRGLEKQNRNGVPLKRIVFDHGYDVSAVHRGLELLGIKGYIPPINFINSPEKKAFHYMSKDDEFVCPEGYRLGYEKLYCVASTGNYLRR